MYIPDKDDIVSLVYANRLIKLIEKAPENTVGEVTELAKVIFQ